VQNITAIVGGVGTFNNSPPTPPFAYVSDYKINVGSGSIIGIALVYMDLSTAVRTAAENRSASISASLYIKY
jgi:hypothetical protein